MQNGERASGLRNNKEAPPQGGAEQMELNIIRNK